MIPPISRSAAAATPLADSGEAVRDAAGKFEALLLAQMLRSARESDSGGGGAEGEPGADSLLEIAEAHLAELLAARGGLGLARLIVQQLQPGQAE
jgi:flagellar protein FlgJ